MKRHLRDQYSITPLLSELIKAGFIISPGTILEIHQVFNTFSINSINDIAYTLGPLLVKSIDQQKKFDSVISEYFLAAHQHNSDVVDDSYPIPHLPLLNLTSSDSGNVESAIINHQTNTRGPKQLLKLAILVLIALLCFAGIQFVLKHFPKATPNLTKIPQPSTTNQSDNQDISIDPSLIILALLIVTVSVYLFFFLRDQLKQYRPDKTALDLMVTDSFKTNELIAEIPFINRDIMLLPKNKTLFSLASSMESKVESDNLVFDLKKTIQHSARNHGIPSLAFSAKKSVLSYVFLINDSNPGNPQLQLYEFLFKFLKEQGVDVDLFYFHDNFSYFYDKKQLGRRSINDLTSDYKDRVAFIFTTGDELLLKFYPALDPSCVKAILNWTFSAIITPVPVHAWAYRETLIQQKFMLIPVEIEKQVEFLIKLITNSRFDNLSKSLTLEEKKRFSGSMAQINELRHYFQDEDLFQWAASLSIFPGINWSIIIELGNAILPKYKFSFSALLLLVRIRWIYNGSIPSRLKLEMLKELTRENEEKARLVLLDSLALIDKIHHKRAAFYQEKRNLELLNKFVLYRHNPTKYALYSTAFFDFKDLYKKKTLFEPMSIHYLENTNLDWNTLLLLNDTKQEQPSSFRLIDALDVKRLLIKVQKHLLANLSQGDTGVIYGFLASNTSLDLLEFSLIPGSTFSVIANIANRHILLWFNGDKLAINLDDARQVLVTVSPSPKA